MEGRRPLGIASHREADRGSDVYAGNSGREIPRRRPHRNEKSDEYEQEYLKRSLGVHNWYLFLSLLCVLSASSEYTDVHREATNSFKPNFHETLWTWKFGRSLVFGECAR